MTGAFLFKIFFARKSLVVKALLFFNMGLWAGNVMGSPSSNASYLIFLIMGGLAVLLLAFALIPFHGWKYKGLGIDEHYERLMVPVLYVFCPINISYAWGHTSALLNALLAVLFLALLAIHFLLLSYHLSDHDRTPPAYFAANLYLKEQDHKF